MVTKYEWPFVDIAHLRRSATTIRPYLSSCSPELAARDLHASPKYIASSLTRWSAWEVHFVLGSSPFVFFFFFCWFVHFVPLKSNQVWRYSEKYPFFILEFIFVLFQFGLSLVRYISDLGFRSVCAFSSIEIHSTITIIERKLIVSRLCGCFNLFCSYFLLIWFGLVWCGCYYPIAEQDPIVMFNLVQLQAQFIHGLSTKSQKYQNSRKHLLHQ